MWQEYYLTKFGVRTDNASFKEDDPSTQIEKDKSATALASTRACAQQRDEQGATILRHQIRTRYYA